MLKSEIANCSFRPPPIHLKYLDRDKMRGYVEKIYLKYLDTDKMRGKVGKTERDAFNGA